VCVCMCVCACGVGGGEGCGCVGGCECMHHVDCVLQVWALCVNVHVHARVSRVCCLGVGTMRPCKGLCVQQRPRRHSQSPQGKDPPHTHTCASARTRSRAAAPMPTLGLPPRIRCPMEVAS